MLVRYGAGAESSRTAGQTSRLRALPVAWLRARYQGRRMIGPGRMAHGMSTRSLASSPLLVVAVLFAVQVASEVPAFHVPVRQQWQAWSHHQGAARPLQRQIVGVAGRAPALAALTAVGEASFAEPHQAPSPFLAAVFVPPRV